MNETTTMMVANLQELGISEGAFEKKDWLDCLTEGIDELPETERLIVSLFYYEELTIQEIGLVLEMPEEEVSKIHYDFVYSVF